MTTTAAVGASQRKDSYQAGRSAIKQALNKLNVQKADLIFLFTSEHYDQAAVLRGVRSMSRSAPIIGCCGGGNLTRKGVLLKSVALMAIKSDQFQINLESGQITSDNIRKVAEQVAEALESQIDTMPSVPHRAVVVLSDSADRKLLDIVAGMTDTLGPICPLVGGGASDHAPARQFFNDQALPRTLVTALLQSPHPIGVGVRHGWNPVGGPLVVSQSEDQFIVKLNGRPAYEVFYEIFASSAPELRRETFFQFTRTHPIGLPQISGEYLIREVVQVRADGGIECVGHIPENAVVRFMQGDRESLLVGAQQAAEDALRALQGHPAAAVLVFDCVSRLPILGDRADEEIAVIQKVFGPETPILGMYSYGEIANPIGVNLAAYHNKTMVVVALPAHS